MAFSDLGSLGATGSTSNNQATLALTTAAAASAGELVVLVIADDNINTTADCDGAEVASITDDSSGGPNLWSRAVGWANNQAAAQGGAAVQIWYSILDHAISNGGAITVTFTSTTLSDATGLTARHFSFSGTQVAIDNINSRSDDAADPGSLDCTTTNTSCLRIRGIAGEVGNNTSLTPTTNWTAWDNGNSATSGTTAEMCARAEHHISTGTSDASDPAWVSCDNASAYVAFKEIGSGICFINSGIYSIPTAATTSLAIPRPGWRKNGNLLLAFILLNNIDTTISVSGTGWTLVESTSAGSGAKPTQAWAWCIVNGSESDPTFSYGSSFASGIIVQLCNTDQSAPIGNFNSGRDVSTTLAVSAITTTRDNSLALAFMDTGGASNTAPLPTNYNNSYFQNSNSSNTNRNVRICYESIATSGSSSDAISVSITSAAWRGVIAEIKSPLPGVFGPQYYYKQRMGLNV